MVNREPLNVVAFYMREKGFDIKKLDHIAKATGLNRSQVIRRLVENVELTSKGLQRDFGLRIRNINGVKTD